MSDTFPPGFFARDDPYSDVDFYRAPRFVTHIDDDAIQLSGRSTRSSASVAECSI